MVEPRSFLFVTWEGGGNLPAVLGVAGQLSARGHRVRVLGEPCMAAAVAAVGADLLQFTRHFVRTDAGAPLLTDFREKSPLAALANTMRQVMYGPASVVADETAAAIAAERPAVVVVDYLMPGALVAAEVAGVPRAVLWHTPEYLPGPGRPAAGPGFYPRADALGRLRDGLLTALFLRVTAPFTAEFNEARGRFGLPPLRGAKELVGEFHRADLRLIQTSRSFDFPLDPAPRNVRYVGAVLDDPHWVASGVAAAQPDGSPRAQARGQTASPPPAASATEPPLVVAGFSSTFQDQAEPLRRTIEALGRLPVTGLVSTGPALDGAGIGAARTPSNVTVSRVVDHRAAFPRAAAVVTHAGHGTVMRALAAGAPLVCLPMGRDQNDNAAKVAYHGAGLRLPKSASARRIAAAVERVMTDQRFKLAAERLGEEVRRDSAAGHAVTELERLAAPAPAASTALSATPTLARRA